MSQATAGQWKDWSLAAETRLQTNGSAATIDLSLRLALPAVVFLLPLAVMPGLARPFSLPKLVLWIAVVSGGLILCRRKLGEAWQRLPRSFQAALMFWLVAVSASTLLGNYASLESLLLLLVGIGWLMLIVAAQPQPVQLAWALVLSGSVVAAIALAQFLHADPFAVVGWIPALAGSARMRVFSTLGNPNFVAAFLSGLLPLTFSLAICLRERRRPLIGLLVLQVAAILSTGSRAPILALAAAALWVAILKQHKSWRALGLIALCIAISAAVGSRTRDLQSTVRGRVYIWKVSAPHLAEHWLLGLGPGGFAMAFPTWETKYWHGPVDDRNRRFVGIQDHAHNDYLEILADYGAAGLLALLAVLAACLRAAWQMRSANDPLIAGASAAVIALAVVAFVDFPLMRPTETFLLWSLLAIGFLRSRYTFNQV